MNEHELKAAKDVWKRNNRVRIERDDNLIGVGLGPKERNGRIRDELAVKFYVRKKVKRGELASEDLLEVPDQIADVVQMAPLRARGSFTQRVRPGVGGCSGCVVVPGLNYTGTLGLGMRGYGGLADRTFVLSDNHVLANENRASVGDPVIQPGSLDGGDPTSDVIGELFDYVPLRFYDASVHGDTPPVNRVDAACAVITQFGNFSREIFWVGYPKGWRDRDSVENAVANGTTGVQKTGRTTGYTQGRISAIAWDGWVNYDTGGAYFEDQMLIEPGNFSDSGDSGSCILGLDEHIIGLLFAGGATHTVANFIEDVWTLLPPIDFSDGLV